MAMAENIGLVVQVQSSPVISPNTLSVVEFTVDDIKEEKKFVFKDPTFQVGIALILCSSIYCLHRNMLNALIKMYRTYIIGPSYLQ